jgi:hypothetical protein
MYYRQCIITGLTTRLLSKNTIILHEFRFDDFHFQIKTHLYHKLYMTLLRAMCEFISYDVKAKNRMKDKIEDWEVEPEIEKGQEEQQRPIPVTQ